MYLLFTRTLLIIRPVRRCTIRGYSAVDDRTATFLRLSVKLLQRIGNIADIDDCIEIVQKCFLVRPQRYSSGRVYFKTHSTHPYCSWGIALCGLVTQELIPYRSMGGVMKSAI